MDLADFDRRFPAGVLLDGVGDALFLKRNRESLQGRPKIVKGARSATNVYSYTYSFCGRAVVATFDLSASNLQALYDDHWLSNRQNVIVLWLKSPAYEAQVDVSVVGVLQPPQAKNAVGWLPPRVLAVWPASFSTRRRRGDARVGPEKVR